MRDLTSDLLELIRLTSTDLHSSVEARLHSANDREKEGSAARMILETILKNISSARQNSTPICQDTGTPLFFVQYPAGWSERQVKLQIRAAVAQATERAWLRPNAVESVTGLNTGNNLGDEHFPVVYCGEIEGDTLTVDLLLKGGGCENVSAQYSLPDESLDAGRDLEGVRKAALHAVWQAQGEGCAPGFLGVAIGGDRATSHLAAKQALLSFVGSRREPVSDDLAVLEERIMTEANQLYIGPMGLGGKTTLLDTRVVATHRLPASYFVSVAYMCWAHRHRRMFLQGSEVRYE